MKPAAFAYHLPRAVEDMLVLLAEHGTEGKILAGGQSLVAAMNFRLVRPAVLLDINEIAALDVLHAENGTLRIGALARHAAFHRPVTEGPLGLLLSRVAGHVAHYPIRQRGTFVGSLAHADPASEWCLVATVLDATIVVRSLAGTRMIPARDFFQGTFTTALAPDELATEVRLPVLDARWRSGFVEVSRRRGDYALAMALVVLRIANGTVREARLGIAGVADRAVRLEAIERALNGQPATAETFAAAADEASRAVKASADIHASAAFRHELIAVVVRRALAQAAGPAPVAAAA